MLRWILKRLISFQFMTYTSLNSQSLLLTFVNFGSGNKRFKDRGEMHGLSLGLTWKTFLIKCQGFYVSIQSPDIYSENL